MSKAIIAWAIYMLILVVAIVVCTKEYGFGVAAVCIAIGLAVGLYTRLLIRWVTE